MYLLPNEKKTKRHNKIVEQITNFANEWIWYDKSVHFALLMILYSSTLCEATAFIVSRKTVPETGPYFLTFICWSLIHNYRSSG